MFLESLHQVGDVSFHLVGVGESVKGDYRPGFEGLLGISEEL
jgi:hypothetical protein